MNNDYNNFENQFPNNNNVNNNVESQQPVQPQSVYQQPVVEPQQPVQPTYSTPVEPTPIVDQPVQEQPTISVGPQQPKKSKIGIVIVGIIVLAIVLVVIKFAFGSKNNVTGTSSSGSNKFGGTFVAATANDTHKGIVYLDPLDLSRACTAEDAAKNVNKYGTPTERRSGCMKFYIYDDSGDTYKMILDHNTGLSRAFDSYWDYSHDTQGWAGNPRLITANEIAHIVGADKDGTLQWEQNKSIGKKVGTYVDWFYLDGSGNSYSNTDGWQKQNSNSENVSKYAWLFDYTANCKKYGCSIEDNNEYHIPDSASLTTMTGYITGDSVTGDGLGTWSILHDGVLYGDRSNNADLGIGFRPVITLSKKIIEKQESIPNPKKKFSGSNFVKAGSNDTHKGIVYMDPSDLSRTCTAEDASNNVNENGTPTGIKFGCMKFYIYDDSGDTYKMILDHNTSGNVLWGYAKDKNVAVSTLPERLNADTKDWQVDVDVISADEIAHIVGIDSKDALNWSVKGIENSGDGRYWFYLDGSGKTVEGWQTKIVSETNKSKYAWLFDYTNECIDNGCNKEDNNGYMAKDDWEKHALDRVLGYWTKVGTAAGGYAYGFSVYSAKLSKESADSIMSYYGGYGIRPVVTIKKSLINK